MLGVEQGRLAHVEFAHLPRELDLLLEHKPSRQEQHQQTPAGSRAVGQDHGTISHRWVSGLCGTARSASTECVPDEALFEQEGEVDSVVQVHVEVALLDQLGPWCVQTS